MQGVIAGGATHGTSRSRHAQTRRQRCRRHRSCSVCLIYRRDWRGAYGWQRHRPDFRPGIAAQCRHDFFSNMPGLGLSAESLTTRLKAIDFERVTIDFGATTQDFYLGRGAVAVPGNVFGLCALVDDFGSLPLRIILQPALDLAQQGLPMAPFQAQTCRLLGPIYTHTRSTHYFTKTATFSTKATICLFPVCSKH